ncbi:DUF402 domain-containing protein [Vulcanisaeta sp. JCM 16159]|uniref:DUF402 domain-containing protein n=1 Tax=Vulcanisaeta sp. JCM 16159 TaxID=1295371 RepID=UPI0006D23481|nr:DUF402 domain-containing protein [Vulcanisaeta sp. JCM 16159]
MNKYSYRIRIRGKYATAISKLVLDLGYTIVQASDVIISRFGINVDNSAPDVTIKDSERVPGALTIMGKCGVVNDVVNNLLRVTEEEALVWRSVVPLHRVVMGVVNVVDGNYFVDVGNGVRAVLKAPGGAYNDGDVIPVVISRTRVYPGDELVAVPGVRVDTEYVSIVPGSGTVLFSRHIKDYEVRQALLKVGLKYVGRLSGYSIKWRSSAQFLDEDEAIKEIERALNTLNEVESVSKSSAPYTVLQDGECIVEVMLNGRAKLLLDNVRNNVIPTIIGHHTYKTLRRNTALLDIVEALLGRCNDRAGFSAEFMRQLMGRRYRIGIIHIRPNGEVLRLGTADVIKLEPDDIVLLRRLRGGGYLDGLGLPKEEGDLAITCTSLGSEYLTHVYVDGSWRPKGIYINVNTPVEFTGANILYIDLAVDVVKRWDSNEANVIDYDEYKTYISMGIVTSKLRDRVEQLINNLIINSHKLGENCLSKAEEYYR